MSETTSQPKAPALSHAPGTFCWWEIITSDLERSRSFYSELFGWSYTENPIGEGRVYVSFQQEGHDVAATYELTPEMKAQGGRPHWFSYIATEDARATTEKVREHGGTVMMEPFDVFDLGSMAILQDPTGAVFAIWQAKAHPGAGLVGEVNTVCWNELATRDAATATAFYRDVFGYEIGTMETPSGPYTLLQQGEAMRGGILQMTDEWPEGIPTHWMPYVNVADCDDTARRAKTLGATLLVPPTDIPPVGRFSVIKDPGGAVFSIIRLNEPA